MRQTSIILLFLALLVPIGATAEHMSRADTIVQAGRHTVIIKEKADDIHVILKERSSRGDTISNEMVFKGVYLSGRKTQTYGRVLTVSRSAVSLFDDEDKPDHMRRDLSMGGFSIGFVMLSGRGAHGLNYASSLRYGINLLRLHYPLSTRWVFSPGLNIEFNSIHFKGNQAYQEVDGVSQLVPAPTGSTYETSRLHVTYLTIPLMMRLRFGLIADRPYDFGLDFGPEIKLRTASSSKVWYPDRKKHDKVGADLNLAPIVLDLRMQLRYRGLGLYATCALTPMFIKGKGPETQMFSMGGFWSF